jgi:membrane protease YdiL (CAAX protease family)
MNSNSYLEKEKEKEYAEWQKRKLSPWAVAASELLNSTIYSPIAEELTFRLVLMKFVAIKTFNMSVWGANIFQASVFGIMHLTNSVYSTQTQGYTNLQTLSATISGLVSGWVYMKSNSILPPLLAHIINNGSAGLTEVVGYIKFIRSHPK